MDIAQQVEDLTLSNQQNGTPVFMYGTAEKQVTLAFPKHVIDHIVMNPSTPKLWMKIIKTCKMFYDRNPIIVIPCMHKDEKSDIFKTCSVGYCDNLEDRDIGDGPHKFWILQGLFVSDKEDDGLVQFVVPRLFRCDAKKVFLSNQDLSIEEFQFLTPQVILGSFVCWVFDDDAKTVPLEKLFEFLPKISTFNYKCNGKDFHADTFKKIAEMEHIKKMEMIALHFMPSTISFDDLLKFCLENKQIQFVLNFDTVTNEACYTKLKAFIQKVNEADYGEYKAPMVSYRVSIDLIDELNVEIQ